MNWVWKYHQHIQDGSVTVGQWVRLAYEKLVEGLQKKSFFYDEKKADKAILFIEKFCRHHEGPLAPGRIVLEEWQKAFISAVFGIVDKDGNRQFREVVLEIGRKNGKTILAAAIVAYHCLFICLILATRAARHLPAHLPDPRQLSHATPVPHVRGQRR